MPPPYSRHIFVCTNHRPPGAKRPCCAAQDSAKLRTLVKAELARRLPDQRIRVNAAGCLDACESGPALVVYPDGLWFGGLNEQNISRVIDFLADGPLPEDLQIKAGTPR